MRRKVEDFRPFTFEADFTPPAKTPPVETVTLPAADLAALGAQFKGEAMAEARAGLDADTVARLESAIERLAGALTDLSTLAERLDRLGHEGHLPEDVARLAEMAARRVSDGQGDLFAACQSLAGSVAER